MTFKYQTTLLFTLLMITGCSLSAQPQVVIVTSDAPPAERTAIVATAMVATPVAAAPTNIPATPTPTSPPTPTVEPALLLQQGDRLRLNGYYEQAIFAYQEVSQGGDTIPADRRAEALFRQGQSAVLEGLFGEAVAPLTDLINTYPSNPNTPQAYFLRGDAYLGLSQWANAITDFQTYLSLRPGLVDSYAHERIGDAQLALGQRDTAIASYTQAINANRSLVPLLALRERVAQIYISGGQTTEAVAQYDAILAVAQNPGYRAQIEYRAGQAYIQGNLPTEGLARMRRVFDTYPTTSTAYDAMLELDAANINLSDYERGVVAYNYGDYPLAIDAFNDFTTQVPLANVPVDT
jgi:soluble lytic murein transglycosylase